MVCPQAVSCAAASSGVTASFEAAIAGTPSVPASTSLIASRRVSTNSPALSTEGACNRVASSVNCDAASNTAWRLRGVTSPLMAKMRNVMSGSVSFRPIVDTGERRCIVVATDHSAPSSASMKRSRHQMTSSLITLSNIDCQRAMRSSRLIASARSRMSARSSAL